MKKIVTLTLALVMLVGATQARAVGQPDSGFGTKGRALLPTAGEEEVASALLRDGRVIVAKRKTLLALLPTGRVDRSFGEGGSAPALVPPGYSGVNVADLALDSQGRLIVAGGAFRAEGNEYKAWVARYTPEGQPDPGFSGDGFALADFGFPPAKPANLTNVSAASVALDGDDRILLSGQRQTGTRLYKGFYVGVYEPFVARLTAAGEEDRTFAGDGVVQLTGYERVSPPLPDADGGIHLMAHRPSGSVLVRLLASGEPDPGFGEGGVRSMPNRTKDFALDGAGGLLTFGKVSGWLRRPLPNGVLIKRLRADGSLDRGFGRKGAATVRMPRTQYGLVAADPRGGILVGLNLRPGRKQGKRPVAPGGVGLARLRPDGRLDRGFGRDGLVEVPFGGRIEAGLQALTVTATEALLTGSWCGGSACGDAFAKVELGAG